MSPVETTAQLATRVLDERARAQTHFIDLWRTMTSCTLITLACTIVLFAGPNDSWAQSTLPAPPARDTPVSQKSGTARLSGRIIALDTGRPIRRAIVSANSTELREGRSISTDAEGRWMLEELPAGRITLRVSKGGFVPLSYGQRRPFEPGKPIQLADGQILENIDIALPRASVVTGRIVDEFGEPVSGVRVTAMRHQFTGGQRRPTYVGDGDTSDDIGQFRLYGLPPGDYYLSAMPGFLNANVSRDRAGYPQTFFPGTPSLSEATRVSLAVGQEAPNVVIPLAPIRMATMSGTATRADGKPIGDGAILLRPAAGSFGTTKTALTGADGTWTMFGLIPGSYELWLQIRTQSLEAIAITGRSGAVSEAVRERVTLTGEDVAGVTLVTAPIGRIGGRIKFEGTPPPRSATWALLLIDLDDTTNSSVTGAVFGPDGSFELPAMGRLLLRVGEAAKGWTLKSITSDGTEVIDTGMDVGPGQNLSNIEVTFTREITEITGTVRNAKGAPVDDYVVVIFANEPEKWGVQTRFVKVGRPDQTGEFTVSGLPPGSYFAVALEYLESGQEGDPEFLARMKDAATSVRLLTGEKKALTLTLSTR